MNTHIKIIHLLAVMLMQVDYSGSKPKNISRFGFGLLFLNLGNPTELERLKLCFCKTETKG